MKNHKHTIIVFLLFAATMTSFGCSKNNNDRDDSDTTATGVSVETRPKVAPDQQPAFAGQTRIGAVRTNTAIRVTTLTSSLSYPWGIASLPDGRMIVTEKPGSIRIVTQQGAIGQPISNVPPVLYRGESGLAAIALDPEFSSSRLVFWTFVEPVNEGGVVAIARGRLSADEQRFENVQIIYRATPAASSTSHNGSQLLFDAQGRLYASFGDHYDDDIRVQAQSLDAGIGKIIRINKDGSAAQGNPFASSARPEIFSLGHRNPQGLAIHPVTGELWESEHGPQAGDEINIIRPGANYGWPVIAYGREYSGNKVGNGTQQNGMEQPVYYWDPAIAPSGITFYTGNLIPEWRNNLFVAALRGTHIVRLVINNNRITGEERLLANTGQRFRKVIQGPDGALYAITDEAEGTIYRIGI